MIVRSSDGEKLGKVIRCGDDEFIVEKGFPKDYVVRYDQATVNGDEVLLSTTATSMREAGDTSGVRERETSASGLGTEMGTYATNESGRPIEGREQGAKGMESRLAHGTSEEVRVPVSEEEVEVRKRGGGITEPEKE